jgi:hypothetical protein
LGIDEEYDWDEGDTEMGVFYNIAALLPYYVKEKQFTEVVFGHKSAICPMPIEEVDALIRKQL